MPVYYNEFDPFAAQWLRELIADGLIAAGEVDERSIVDVQPDDLRGFTQCHFFAGIGGWSAALRLAGWADDRHVWTGSCPCQPFSAAGKGEGFEDSRHLWPAWFRLIGECRPSVVFGEQVASADGRAWFDTVSTDLEETGYAVGAANLCAAGAGAPHIRQRLYFVADANGGRREQRDAGERGVSESCARITTDRMGNAEHDGSFAIVEPGSAEATRRMFESQGPGAACRLEHTESDGRIEGRAESERRSVAGGCSDDGLADAGCCTGRAEQEQQHSERTAESRRSGAALGMADSERRTAERHGFDVAGTPRTAEGATQERERLRTDARNGGADHWRNVIWLPCTDGKYRPTEPGIFPLASGVRGRVGILRGAGNSIVPQVAALFIQAAEESMNTTDERGEK